MRGDLWLGLDIGTQGVRSLLVSTTGVVAGSGERQLGVSTGTDGRMTHDPIQWRSAILGALKDALDGVEACRVAGIGTGGLFPSVVALDSQGQPIGEAVLYGDSRAREHTESTAAALGVRLRGDEVSPRLAWLAAHDPETLGRAKVVVGPTGFAVHLLTGRATIDPQSAYRWGGMVDAARLSWRTDLDAVLGVRVDQLPQIRRSTDIVGGVGHEAAALTGLAPGTPVIAGVTDSLASFVGAGAVRRGDAQIYYGSSGTLMVCTSDLADAIAYPAILAEEVPWQLAAYALESGRLLEVIRREMCGNEPFDELDGSAADVPPGAHGVRLVPFVAGRLTDGGRTRPATSLEGLELATSRADIWRASLEAFGYVVAGAIDDLPSWWAPGRVVATGGGARSDIWRGIVSAITGLPQQHDPRASAALGAALVAAFAGGAVPILDPVAAGWLDGRGAATEPDPASAAAYRDLRPRWQEAVRQSQSGEAA